MQKEGFQTALCVKLPGSEVLYLDKIISNTRRGRTISPSAPVPHKAPGLRSPLERFSDLFARLRSPLFPRASRAAEEVVHPATTRKIFSVLLSSRSGERDKRLLLPHFSSFSSSASFPPPPPPGCLAAGRVPSGENFSLLLVFSSAVPFFPSFWTNTRAVTDCCYNNLLLPPPSFSPFPLCLPPRSSAASPTSLSCLSLYTPPLLFSPPPFVEASRLVLSLCCGSLRLLRRSLNEGH